MNSVLAGSKAFTSSVCSLSGLSGCLSILPSALQSYSFPFHILVVSWTFPAQGVHQLGPQQPSVCGSKLNDASLTSSRTLCCDLQNTLLCPMSWSPSLSSAAICVNRDLGGWRTEGVVLCCILGLRVRKELNTCALSPGKSYSF